MGAQPGSLAEKAIHDPQLRKLIKAGERKAHEDANAMERYAHEQEPKEMKR